MRHEIFLERAEEIRGYSGTSVTVAEICRLTGLTRPTVARYEKMFGFVFNRERGRPRMASDQVPEIKRLAAEGKTRKQVSIELSISPNTLVRLIERYGIEFVHGSVANRKVDARAEIMLAMYQAGKTLAEIGAVYDLTRERVRQVMNKNFGTKAAAGGQHIRACRKASKRAADKERRYQQKYGCSTAEYGELSKIGERMREGGALFSTTPIGAFTCQKKNAERRGIPWQLSLWDWWQVWDKSGKWENRGRHKGEYVMCRFGDVGAYEVGNVYIATCSHNCSVQPNNPRRQSSSMEIAA